MRNAMFGAVVVLILVVIVVVARRRRVTPAADLQAGIQELASAAVALARENHSVTLDYSVESVERVEQVLAAVHDRTGKTEVALEEHRDLATKYGAYVGEVIRRKWGGHWEQDHVAGGPNSYPIHSQGHQSFPIGWCFKRLRNGPEDNIWHKLQILYLNEGQPLDLDPGA